MSDLKTTCDSILSRVTSASPNVPGVVAMMTDRNRNTYTGAAGARVIGGAEMTEDTVFAMFSTTKAITSTAALQCLEDGLLDLDAPAREYAPAIGKLQVLEGFDNAGQPILRKPKSDVTTRQLLTHTGGFGYDFFDENYNRMGQEHGQPSIVTCSRASLETPLLFDPGTQWKYGTNLDWVGQVVEGIRGKRLGAVFQERIFKPLGMNDMAFTRTESMKQRVASCHARGEDGSLTDMDFFLPDDPEVDCGGHGLYGTVPDYMKFIRMWLNDGAGADGRVLKPETVEMAVRNQLEPHQTLTMLPGVIPSLSNDAEFFPGLEKGWSFGFMTNEQTAPTGRPAGALGWAGLANLFYWIDRENGIGGFWATQILPFADPVSFGGYMDFETAAYQALPTRSAA